MGGERDLDEIRPELATAVGYLALTDATPTEAADRAGVTRLELEECLQAASLADQFGVDVDLDVRDQIDRVLEEYSE